MIHLLLFYEFAKIGLFSFGGGLSIIPFLYDLTYKYNWFSQDILVNMIAISESTPGPLGINMATYVGYETAKLSGALASVLGLIAPAFIIVLIVAKLFNHLNANGALNHTFNFIRPVVASLILSSVISIFTIIFLGHDGAFRYKETILLIILLLLVYFKSAHPIIIIALAGLIGFIFKL
jgi:chromate transporter